MGKPHFWRNRLTPKQTVIFRFMVTAFIRFSRMVTCQDVADAFKMSRMRAFRHFGVLVRKGYLKRHSDRKGWSIVGIEIDGTKALARIVRG